MRSTIKMQVSLFAILGLIAVILFYAGDYFPVWFSVLTLVFVSLMMLQKYRRKRVGMLMLMLWLVYVLPFIHIVPYIWFDFSIKPLLLWGLAVNPYMIDERVIQLTAMIGAVGAIGFAVGACLNSKIIQQDTGKNPDGYGAFRTLAMPIWLAWVAVGIFLTAMSAPQQTVFTATYTESGSALENVNFSSAWMMSYVVLSFAFSDALLERKANMKKLKKFIMAASVLLVVVYYQLLRGDRESIPWVMGLVLAYYYWAAGVTQRPGFIIPWLRLFLIVVGLLVINLLVGLLRSQLLGLHVSGVIDLIGALYQSDRIGLSNLFTGTWSAVLLTPLSVAGDHIYGLLHYKYGQDYLHLLQSSIPGFVADAIGYVRPIDSNHGPAWEMRYGLGGTHATVVPFMNFGMLGVLLITTLWASLINRFEKAVVLRLSITGLSFLITMAMALPHWLWYGEKSGMNALMMWTVLAFIYRLSLGWFKKLEAKSGTATYREEDFVG